MLRSLLTPKARTQARRDLDLEMVIGLILNLIITRPKEVTFVAIMAIEGTSMTLINEVSGDVVGIIS